MNDPLRLTPNPRFAFCESVQAVPLGRWHIRAIPIGEQPMLGGGITTGCLCGHVKAGRGWDLEVALTPHHLAGSAHPRCVALYRAEKEGAC